MLSADIDPRITDAFRTHGQGHVLRHIDALAPRERAAFVEQLAEVDLALMAKLIAGGGDAKTDLSKLAPAPYVALGSPIAVRAQARSRRSRSRAAKARASAGADRRGPTRRPA